MNCARAALHHSAFTNTHCEDSVRDAAFKYSNMQYHATNALPYIMWINSTPNVPQFLLFGQLCTIPKLANRKQISKLAPQGHTRPLSTCIR